MPGTDLLNELEVVVSDLCAINAQLAMIRAEEHRQKLIGYLNCEGSDTAKRRHGDIQAMECTASIFELEAELFTLTERKWLIQTKLKYTDAGR